MKTFRFAGLVFLVFTLGISCSEREISSEKLQQRGDNLYYAVNENKPYSGKVVDTYKSEQKRAEITYKNGKLHGVSTRWYSDGQKKDEISYKDGQLSGSYRTWYDSGQQEKEIAYKDGKENGQWVFWYSNGQKQRECSYKDGQLSGSYRTWYDSGQQEKEGAYKDGKQDGEWDFWTWDGRKYGRKYGVVKDIDGNTYLTIKIGEQWWMAENLKVTRYRNGDAISHVTDDNAWENLSSGGYCSYENDPANAETYGYLYNWYAVNDPRGLAPKGWHVPTDAEWKQLEMSLGMSQPQADDDRWRGTDEGDKLKEIGTAHWKSYNEGATNESVFSALPGGSRNYKGSFEDSGYEAWFWSSTEGIRDRVWYRHLRNRDSEVFRYSGLKQEGYSVRCVRD